MFFKKPIPGKSNHLPTVPGYLLRFGPYSRNQITSNLVGLFNGDLNLYRYNPLSFYRYALHTHFQWTPSPPDTLAINLNS